MRGEPKCTGGPKQQLNWGTDLVTVLALERGGGQNLARQSRNDCSVVLYCGTCRITSLLGVVK